MKGGVRAFSGSIGNRIVASQIKRERTQKETEKVKRKMNKTFYWCHNIYLLTVNCTAPIDVKYGAGIAQSL
jgi:hypothetical protein